MTYIGCHVSIAGGIDKAPERARELGCEVMQIFTRSPQGGKASDLTPDLVSRFKLKAKTYKLKATYIHTPYYINFASSDNRIRYGSINVVRSELERGSLIGAKYVMTHLGSAKELPPNEAMEKVIEGLKKIFDGYNGETQLLLENSAGAGGVIGSTFEEFGLILKSLHNYKSLVGICLDTQHTYASGYDWDTDYKKTLSALKTSIGIEKVKLIHANDSKVGFNEHKDRHEHIGKGKIGLQGFKNIVALAKKNKIDLILETEHPGVVEDIRILKKMRG